MSKIAPESRFQRLLTESAAGQVTRGASARARAAPRDGRARSDSGLEALPTASPTTASVRGLGARRSVPDRRVAPAPLGERLGPTRATRARRRRGRRARAAASDSSAACGADGPLLQPFGDAALERSRRRSARPATASASARRSSRPQQSQRCAVERPPSTRPARTTTSDREHAPRRAVELDRHAAAPVVAQPR